MHFNGCFCDLWGYAIVFVFSDLFFVCVIDFIETEFFWLRNVFLKRWLIDLKQQV